MKYESDRPHLCGCGDGGDLAQEVYRQSMMVVYYSPEAACGDGCGGAEMATREHGPSIGYVSPENPGVLLFLRPFTVEQGGSTPAAPPTGPGAPGAPTTPPEPIPPPRGPTTEMPCKDVKAPTKAVCCTACVSMDPKLKGVGMPIVDFADCMPGCDCDVEVNCGGTGPNTVTSVVEVVGVGV